MQGLLSGVVYVKKILMDSELLIEIQLNSSEMRTQEMLLADWAK